MEEDDVKLDDADVFSSIQDLLHGKKAPVPSSKGLVQIKKAPNQVIFIESEEYLDGPKLHEPQYNIVRDFFELLCPKCNDIARIRTIGDVPRNKQVLFEYDTCPICGTYKYSGLYTNDLRFYNELIGVVGMRGGKSVLVACMAAAVLHEILHIDDLQKKLELVHNQMIEGAFVAASGEQASETIYGHFRGFYDNSPWFQNYKKALISLEASTKGTKKGTFYWETDKAIIFRDRHIRIKSLHSNSSSLAGKTRIFTVIDEIARLDQGQSKRSSTEVYRVLKRSLMTVKASVDRLNLQGNFEIPNAKMFCISSPMYQDDKSMLLLKEAEKNKKMFAFHQSTWEFNPEITREVLAEEFAADPLGAERDYGANPPGAENPLVRNPGIIEICVDTDRPSIFTLKEIFFDTVVQGVTFSYIKMEVLDVKYRNLNDYVIHCDPGQHHDSYCLAIGHRTDDDVVVIDGAIEAKPLQRGRASAIPREVYFPQMVDIILNLHNKLCLKYVSYDRWNSTEQIHRLINNGILAFGKNLTRDDHIRFVNSMEQRMVRFPKREHDSVDAAVSRNMPCAKALYELKRLNDTGTKVDHLTGGSNDMIQCYVGVYRLLVNPEDVVSKEGFNRRSMNKSLMSRNTRSVGRFIRLPQKRVL